MSKELGQSFKLLKPAKTVTSRIFAATSEILQLFMITLKEVSVREREKKDLEILLMSIQTVDVFARVSTTD